MPPKRITFIVIPANDGQVREYRFPPWILWCGILAAVCFCGAFAFYSKGFYQKVDQEKALAVLQDENGGLLRSIELSRREVEQLDETMVQLMADDDLLRAYHQMEPLSADIRQVGVGGSEDLPEDFTALPSEKRRIVRDLGARIDYLKRMASLQQESFEEIEYRDPGQCQASADDFTGPQGNRLAFFSFWRAHGPFYRPESLSQRSRFCRSQRYADLCHGRWGRGLCLYG